MSRYHIKKDGTPGICHAQPGHCPLGGEGEHYPSMEAAQAAADIKNMENFSKSDIINKSLNKINPKSNRKHYQVKGSGKIKINRAMNKLGKKAKYRVKRSAKKLARAPIKITTKVAKKAVRKAISSKLGYQQMYQLTGYFSPNYTPH